MNKPKQERKDTPPKKKKKKGNESKLRPFLFLLTALRKSIYFPSLGSSRVFPLSSLLSFSSIFTKCTGVCSESCFATWSRVKACVCLSNQTNYLQPSPGTQLSHKRRCTQDVRNRANDFFLAFSRGRAGNAVFRLPGKLSR